MTGGVLVGQAGDDAFCSVDGCAKQESVDSICESNSEDFDSKQLDRQPAERTITPDSVNIQPDIELNLNFNSQLKLQSHYIIYTPTSADHCSQGKRLGLIFRLAVNR